MQCFIYKGTKKSELYLYIENKDDFSKVPETLFASLGVLEFVMELELTPEQKLVREDVNKVMTSLKSKGFLSNCPRLKLALLIKFNNGIIHEKDMSWVSKIWVYIIALASI